MNELLYRAPMKEGWVNELMNELLYRVPWKRDE